MNENIATILVTSVFFIVSFLIYNYMRITIDRKQYSDKENLTRNYIEGLGAELLGAGITTLIAFLLFQALVTSPEEKRLNLVEDLKDNDKAAAAIDELRNLGWLVDGSLNGADLSSSVLEEANLQSANLVGSNLTDSHLASANLTYAQLDETELVNVDLSSARLVSAQLVNANLQNADLSDAILVNANLVGANLVGATLTAKTDLREAILPDGTVFSENTDLTRYTTLAFARSNGDAPTANTSALQFTNDPNTEHYRNYGARGVVHLYANPVMTDIRVCRSGADCTDWMLGLSNPVVMESATWLFEAAQAGDVMTVSLRNDVSESCTVWVVGAYRYCGIPTP